MNAFLLGLDDTDAGDSIGTGALARELSIHLRVGIGAEIAGITRHQLLVHPEIPYTSHNSAACIGLRCKASGEEVFERAARFVSGLPHEGADPGICLISNGSGTEKLIAWGRRAQTEVLGAEEANETAADAQALLQPLGGDGGGVIGALAACGLRSSGMDGRFIALPGIREMEGIMSVAEILGGSPIEAVWDEEGNPLAPETSVDTRGWIRPGLADGRIVLRTVRDAEGKRVRVEEKKSLDKH